MLGKSLHLCFSRLKRNPSATTRGGAATSPATTTTTTVIYKNYNNSIYDPAASDDTETPTTGSTLYSRTTEPSSEEDADDGADSSSSDLATAIASRRFFPAAPGRSNSIVDAAAVDVGGAGAAGFAVPTYSPDPYWDFRRSMEEMVEALGLDPRAHRAHLHELLLCYLALNRKHAHKYIVGAFNDILAAAAAAAAGGSGDGVQ